MEAGVIIVQLLMFVVGIVVLGWIIKTNVRKGIEDVLYKKDAEGRWALHPWLLEAVQEAAEKSKKPSS